ncbi:MAG: bacterial proteasome activator family protein [Actinomycetota bacterium]|nr:bacterial proteasome activator family protein [Actinomycetota bacterium]
MTISPEQPLQPEPAIQEVTIIGPDGLPISTDESGDAEETEVESLVQSPAKVMRIGSMIKQLLDEVKSAPLDESARVRLREIHLQSIKELEDALAPELVDELERLSQPFNDPAPSEAELRIAQAQLVGWLEGLFHGIQAALYAQQMTAKAQFEEMRRQATAQGQLPPGAGGSSSTGQYL